MKELVHELSIWSPFAQETHTARCTCEWQGKLRATRLSAEIDMKQHRIDTATDDEVTITHRRPKKARGRVAPGSIADVQAKGGKC